MHRQGKLHCTAVLLPCSADLGHARYSSCDAVPFSAAATNRKAARQLFAANGRCLPSSCFQVAVFPSLAAPLNLPQGRLLLWAWLQERRAPGAAATYSGCLSVPRVLSLSADGRRLLQQPAPEVARLRRCYRSHPGDGAQAAAGSDTGVGQHSPATAGQAGAAAAAGEEAGAVAPDYSGRGGWYSEGVEVAEEQPLPVEGVSGAQLDLELCFSRWAVVERRTANWGVPGHAAAS